MGQNSPIEWTAFQRADGTWAPGHTQNFWIGCDKVSEACKFCYAEVETYPRVQRARGRELWGKNAERHVTSAGNWRKPYAWNAAAAAAGERHRVFVNSMSDFFERRDDLLEPRAQAWQVIRDCPHLDFLLVTKRPENILDMLPAAWGNGWPNVWIGCTVENQDRANERLPHLLRVPAVVLFVSCEPLLGWIDLTQIRWADHLTGHKIVMNALNGDAVEHVSEGDVKAWSGDEAPGHHLRWVIIGGESGRAPRAFDIEAGRHVVKQCRNHGVAAFVKQLGAKVVKTEWHGDVVSLDAFRHRKGGDPAEWPSDMRVREFPTPRAA